MRVFLLTLSIALVACNSKQNVGSTDAAPAPAPAAASAAAPPAAAPPAGEQISGKVLETMNSGGYTYVRVATAGGEKWAAVRETKIAKGDNVAIDAQMTMQAFESKGLGRKFDAIAFGSIAGPGAPPAAMPSGEAKDHMKAPAAAVDVMVERAAGGKTVGEVWAERAALKDKDVVVRGRVVKALSGIMGSNWIHIQDGSGSGETRDLTVTTQDTAAVGDLVTVKGTVRADKDFGYGYKYAVIVENARVAKN